MVEFPIYRSTEHREHAALGKCSCVGCALSSGIIKFAAWKDCCRVRGAGTPDEQRFADRLSLAVLHLYRDGSLITPKERKALAKAMLVSEETAQEILNAAKKADEKGVPVHEGHRSPLRQLGQRYCKAILNIGGGRLRFDCVPHARKKAKEPMLCLDTWDDWFPAAGVTCAAVVDNDVVSRWNEPVPLAEMETFCATRAADRGPVLRAWTFHHSPAMISLLPHKGSVPVCYAMTRPLVLLPHE